jgi:phosphatidate cytidylyltransferase
MDFTRVTWILVGSAIILSIFSQIGDFFESFIKRRLNLKDSSNIIPGHGGLFDRVDGLLFASTLMGVVLFIINQGWFK